MADGLVLENLCLRLRGAELVRIETRVAPGEIVTVMGPSGSGKSTLLAAIVGNLPRDIRLSGRILLDGRDITVAPTGRRRVGILFQDDLLFPHLSVADNLAFGLTAGGSKAERKEAVAAALSEIGLDGFDDRDPATLSGGQRARVALMRTLLSDPRALLLDEPFSSLDRALRDQMREVVFSRAESRNLPTLLVTHDPDDARAAGGRTIQLDATRALERQGPGRGAGKSQLGR